ncbi:hypothetical protein H6P81_006803 [Aristolochia fimbriata]|uniref:DYW domain-containing protein n=1 Tax=Aristolochia fimbriata TaxID=158543 RepID=A0AAV7EZ74_ARIFI|nr:hypothetical protein H6P81_006803 [Aristolochia fimbriata]
MAKPSVTQLCAGSYCTATGNRFNVRETFIKLCSKGSLKEAFENFAPEIWSDPSLFANLLQGCVPKQSVSTGKQLHSLIIASGVSSDKFVSNHLLNVYAKCGELKTATMLFNSMPRKNVMSSNILIGGFIQNGDLETARKLFDNMPERNVATWNAMVTGSVHYGFNEEGLEYFSKAHRLGLRPDEFTLGSVLRGCAGLKTIKPGVLVHAYVIKSGLHMDLCVGSSLAHMYMKCGSVRDGEKVFEGMPIHNVVACNTIIAGRAQNGYAEGALDHFNLMRMAGFKPDQITFVSVISSCSELATLGQGLQVHAQAIKVGVDSVVSVRTSLINMYSKCGCLEDSTKIFSESLVLDIVLWTAMIGAYGFHGRGHEAVKLFRIMETEGMEPNDVTFLGLLYACSHSGLKKEGTQFFELMTEKYGLSPRIEHYTCVVDLLARSGCLDEAEQLIKLMPVKPDGVIWKTLLSACKIHRKAEIAKRVTSEVLKLDPEDSAPYVLLSNINASAERWVDVSDVREAMRGRNVKKEPGISWLEVKNEVYQFCMGDRSHPKWEEINRYLEELMGDMKRRGYVPDMASVLHDMEEEEKEHTLVHHSEKLAIAFGLMSTPSCAPIRIMKNLRVCNDCHVAIKFISKISLREIIVRDASRFHHFKDGECSCGDYW